MNEESGMDYEGPDEDLIPGYKCPECGHNVCKDEWAGKRCIDCDLKGKAWCKSCGELCEEQDMKNKWYCVRCAPAFKKEGETNERERL